MTRNLSALDDDVRLMAYDLIDLFTDEQRELLIYCTYRSPEDQARLFRKGRKLYQIEDRAKDLYTKYGRPDLADILINVGPQYGIRQVTGAGPGQSYHQYSVAIDAVPLRYGKPVWGRKDPEDKKLWLMYGECAESLGFNWAGRWRRTRREYPHIQKVGKTWKELIQA